MTAGTASRQATRRPGSDELTDDQPEAFLAVEGTKVVGIYDRLVVGREALGTDDRHRLLIDDPSVSRHHLEIRLDATRNRAEVIDTSTNGTRLNGLRIARADPVALRHGDRLRVGDTELEFRSERFRGSAETNPTTRSTLRNVSLSTLAMVVGDIVSFSTISQYTDDAVVFRAIDRLYGELNKLLVQHRGTLNNYVGDAFFAIWECDDDPEAARNALRFALAATTLVRQLAPELPLRDPQGNSIRMGWGVVMGRAAMSSLTNMLVTVLGDATNLVFRISGLAGRGGRADVVVTSAIRDIAGPEFWFDPGSDVSVKGRTGTETVFGAHTR